MVDDKTPSMSDIESWERYLDEDEHDGEYPLVSPELEAYAVGVASKVLPELEDKFLQFYYGEKEEDGEFDPFYGTSEIDLYDPTIGLWELIDDGLLDNKDHPEDDESMVEWMRDHDEDKFKSYMYYAVCRRQHDVDSALSGKWLPVWVAAVLYWGRIQRTALAEARKKLYFRETGWSEVAVKH